MIRLERFSMGVGDRFGRQGRAQLAAFHAMAERGVDVVPVWNKSHREHQIIGTSPIDVRVEADAAVRAMEWTKRYYVDADHINVATVDPFMHCCDFFTLDVADSIGKPAPDAQIAGFLARHAELIGEYGIEGVAEPLNVSREEAQRIAGMYLGAVSDAAKLYRRIASARGDDFVTEVSMDETDTPQTPVELLFILAALADEKVPLQTIAPRFCGQFLKGVDYVGDPDAFAREFSDDLAVIRFAVSRYVLPATLKLSVHSGSDKFALYPLISECLARSGAGVHLKTAGTTWLEELVGLCEAGGCGLDLVKEMYSEAVGRFDELCAPYASVIAINRGALPPVATVQGWSGQRLAAAVRHDQQCSEFDRDLRQLFHVAYKLAAERFARFHEAVNQHEEIVAHCVAENLFLRHMYPLFGRFCETATRSPV